ncbi:inositol monophosphatase family protein [Bacillus alkalicellulosilyticus]|uniref:inositol monophosphatase family protein n=1 Tax=Alkalihalobacterium alkalicellulosilyticum TaxID=1912214 RepID=UPI001FEAFE66|nr:inositol monophosphatase [Bacillus alkalicellulosilyticus]
MRAEIKDEIYKHAISWVKEAGTLLKKSLTKELKVEWKSNPDDLVTEMDRAIEAFLVSKISSQYPTHSILGEEGTNEGLQSEENTIWIIDPIDGTTNFVHQQFNFAISVAVFSKGKGEIGLIYDVMSDELFHVNRGQGAFLNEDKLNSLEKVEIEKAIISLNARWLFETNAYREQLTDIAVAVRGVRAYGSAALELAYVAAGRVDGYISMYLAPWDFAAGLVLLDEVGGIYTNINGEPLPLLNKNSIFAGKPGFHQEMLGKLNRKV